MGKLTVRPPTESTAKLVTYEGMGIGTAELSQAIVQRYFGNYVTVSALAAQYGFRYEFFFQPIISIGSKPLTGEELTMKRRWEHDDPALSALCTATYQAARESPKYPHYRNLMHVFDGYAPLVWIDEYHVTPVGNQLIAEAILHNITTGSFLKHQWQPRQAAFKPDSTTTR